MHSRLLHIPPALIRFVQVLLTCSILAAPAVLAQSASRQPPLVSTFSPLSLQSQPNGVFFEFGGAAGVYSLNYERSLLALLQTHIAGARAGFSWLPFAYGEARDLFLFPLSIFYLYRYKQQHYIETGAGTTIRIYTDAQRNADNADATLLLHLGYRFQMIGSGSQLRIFYEPHFFNGYKTWFGISLGRVF
jgi:hypothetical protein